MEKVIKVIMLEDNADDAKLIQKTLQRANLPIETTVLFNRENFISAINSFSPDLILSDHQLPQFNSMDALQICRELLPFTPFILVTGTVSEEFAASIIKAGADDYVLKNNLNRLPTAVQQAIQKKRTQYSLHQAEDDLLIAHRRLLFHIENTPLGFIEWDTKSEIKIASQRSMEIFGWTESGLTDKHKDNFCRVFEEDVPWVSQITDQLITGKIERNTIQYRNYTRDGKVIWCEWYNSVLKDQDGKVVTISSLVQDITEKKLAEQQKEFDRNNLAALINNTGDLMWSVDRNYKFITSNNAFNEMIMQLSGKTISPESDVKSISGFSEEQLQRFMSYYDRAFAGETFNEIEYTSQPIEMWGEISYYPIRKGNEVIGTACYSRDITSRKREEAHLKLLESVITHATEAVLITEAIPQDEPGPRIMYVNDAFTKMTGYLKSEVMGKSPRILQGPRSDKGELDRLRKCMEKSESCEIEIINYKKNGDPFWINMAIAPVINANGVTTHFIAIEKDVTERLNNLQSIKEQNNKLRDIAWMQSHDVRGPVARIMGLINLMQNHSDKVDSKEILNYLMASANELDVVIKKIVAKTEEVG